MGNDAGGWRKRVGVEPTKTVLQPSLVLKTSRDTGLGSLPCPGFTRFFNKCNTEQNPNCHPIATEIVAKLLDGEYFVHDLVRLLGRRFIHSVEDM